ncbi:MAG: hypothetical protein M3389_04265, partial [Actinomycetota bacterium]|nr:hypothetical protein [Actinomycetota bacterium]
MAGLALLLGLAAVVSAVLDVTDVVSDGAAERIAPIVLLAGVAVFGVWFLAVCVRHYFSRDDEKGLRIVAESLLLFGWIAAGAFFLVESPEIWVQFLAATGIYALLELTAWRAGTRRFSWPTAGLALAIGFCLGGTVATIDLERVANVDAVLRGQLEVEPEPPVTERPDDYKIDYTPALPADHDPTFEELCPGSDQPGTGARPARMRRRLNREWLGGEGRDGPGALVAGCPKRAQRVRGLPGGWLVLGSCERRLRSLALAPPTAPSAILLDQAAH